MEFSPILIIALIWLCIGLPLSKMKQQTAKGRTTDAGAKPGKARSDPKAPPAETPVSAGSPMSRPEPARPTILAPSISVTEHDDSVYEGSMYAVTGEGSDPCHEEMLSSPAPSYMPAPAETAEPGLQLSWTGSEIVRGVVMSEILNRRQPGVRRP